jgi:hypothetical protein
MLNLVTKGGTPKANNQVVAAGQERESNNQASLHQH